MFLFSEEQSAPRFYSYLNETREKKCTTRRKSTDRKDILSECAL